MRALLPCRPSAAKRQRVGLDGGAARTSSVTGADRLRARACCHDSSPPLRMLKPCAGPRSAARADLRGSGRHRGRAGRHHGAHRVPAQAPRGAVPQQLALLLPVPSRSTSVMFGVRAGCCRAQLPCAPVLGSCTLESAAPRCMRGWGWSRRGASCCTDRRGAARRRWPTPSPTRAASPSCASPRPKSFPACQVSGISMRTQY